VCQHHHIIIIIITIITTTTATTLLLQKPRTMYRAVRVNQRETHKASVWFTNHLFFHVNLQGLVHTRLKQLNALLEIRRRPTNNQLQQVKAHTERTKRKKIHRWTFSRKTIATALQPDLSWTNVSTKQEIGFYYAPQLVPPGTAEARISYGISVCLSVCPSVRHDPVRIQCQMR